MASRFELDQGRLRQVLQTEATKLIRQGQRVTLNSAKMRSPVDTGQLRASHQAGNITIKGNTISGEVVAEQDYSEAVHDGTRPHVIRPRRAKALTWMGPQGRVFARSVNHPGTKARPWLFNALQSEGPRLGFVVTPGP